jgi:hypothetical protein
MIVQVQGLEGVEATPKTAKERSYSCWEGGGNLYYRRIECSSPRLYR